MGNQKQAQLPKKGSDGTENETAHKPGQPWIINISCFSTYGRAGADTSARGFLHSWSSINWQQQCYVARAKTKTYMATWAEV